MSYDVSAVGCYSRMPADYSIAASLYHFQLFLVYGAARIALISAGESNMQNSERGRYLTARGNAVHCKLADGITKLCARPELQLRKEAFLNEKTFTLLAGCSSWR